MPVIQPVQGRDQEYALLGVDLFYGCGHGCVDCPVTERMYKTPRRFYAGARLRAGVLGALKREVANLRRFDGPVLLCPNTDPYQRGMDSNWVVRTAIEIINRRGLGVVIRTKAGRPAERDLALLQGNKDNLLVVPMPLDETIRQEREPQAAPIKERMALIQLARFLGINNRIVRDSRLCPRISIGGPMALQTLPGSGAEPRPIAK